MWGLTKTRTRLQQQSSAASGLEREKDKPSSSSSGSRQNPPRSGERKETSPANLYGRSASSLPRSGVPSRRFRFLRMARAPMVHAILRDAPAAAEPAGRTSRAKPSMRPAAPRRRVARGTRTTPGSDAARPPRTEARRPSALAVRPVSAQRIRWTKDPESKHLGDSLHPGGVRST